MGTDVVEGDLACTGAVETHLTGTGVVGGHLAGTGAVEGHLTGTGVVAAKLGVNDGLAKWMETEQRPLKHVNIHFLYGYHSAYTFCVR